VVDGWYGCAIANVVLLVMSIVALPRLSATDITGRVAIYVSLAFTIVIGIILGMCTTNRVHSITGHTMASGIERPLGEFHVFMDRHL